MTNRQVAEAFANYETEGHSLHMFIEGDTIYSYGSHFPIAYRTGVRVSGQEIALFNSDGYSVTTSSHQSDTRYELSQNGFLLIEIPTEALKSYIFNAKYGEGISGKVRSQMLNDINDRVFKFQEKARRARLEGNREWYTREAKENLEQLNIVRSVLLPFKAKYL